MKILVTGGAGYIGSHAVYELIKDNHEVIVLDNLSTGNREAVHKDAKFYEGDQKDTVLLDKIFAENKIDVVMHFSAKLIVPESVEQPIEYFENNIHGVAVLLESMKKNKIKNIVFSSTAAVYGNPVNIPSTGITENMVTAPINPYGQSKLACEWLIKNCQKAFDINYVIFRYFNVAGADKSGEIGLSAKGRQLTHLIPVVVETGLKQREKMNIFGDTFDTKDGTCVRDYIHVTDLVKAHINGAKYTLKNKSGIFNLGSSNGFSVQEVVDTVEEVLGHPINYSVTGKRKGDPAMLVANNDNAVKELSFETTHNLKEIIISDINWRKNRKY